MSLRLTPIDVSQIQRVCNHSPYSAMKLFAPYWRTVAVTVLQDIHRRPQVIQQVADLLAMNVSDFLVMTQVHTVPYFVLTKKQDVLQRIAEASSLSVMALCREHNNLAATLATLMIQTSTETETLVMTILYAASPEFNNVNCLELLRSEPQATAAELLKLGVDNAVEALTKVRNSEYYSTMLMVCSPIMRSNFFRS